MKSTIGLKIAFAFVVILILMGMIVGISSMGLVKIVSRLDNMEHESVKRGASGELRYSIAQLLGACNDYIITEKDYYKREFNRINLNVDNFYKQFIKLQLSDEELQLTKKIKEDLDSIHTISTEIFSTAHPRQSLKAWTLMERMDYRFGEDVNLKATQIFDYISRRIEEHRVHASADKASVSNSIYFVTFIAIAMSFIVGYLTVQRISKPIITVTKAANGIANGDYSHRPVVNTRDEIADLAKSFSIMAESIQRTQHALEESKKLTESIVETVPVGLMVFDPNGKILSVNNSFCNFFELSHNLLLYQNIKSLFDTLNVTEECRDHFLSQNSVRDVECSYYDPEKGKRIFNLSIIPLQLTNNESLLILEDITERKRAEEALRASEEKYRQVVQNIDEIIYSVKTENNLFGGTVRFVSDQVKNIIGYQPDEFLLDRELWFRIIHPEDVPEVMEITRKQFASKKTVTRVYRIQCKTNGQYRWVEDRSVPEINEQGNVVGIFGVVRDITEQKRAEEALAQQSTIFETFFENTISPLVFLDKDFNFIRVNNAYAKVCQRDRSEFPGHNHFELYPSDAKAVFEKVVRTKEAVRFVERPFAFPDHPEWGVTYWDWSLTPIMDKMGEVEFLVFALRDVTERKKGIDEIRKSHEQLRALYSHLQNAREEERTRIAREIHDSIGQSLTGLKMDLSLLETELAQQEDLRERNKLYGKIQTMYILLDEMIQSVRDVSAQLRPLILDSLGLVTAIEWQMEEFQKKTGLKCKCILPQEKVELNRDESTVLFRIFQECLTNIIRHAKATKVSIKLERKKNHILLEVQDNGIGIDENVVKEINSLGLLGMKERALVFGGSVDILGNPGRGTIITVKIPKGE